MFTGYKTKLVVLATVVWAISGFFLETLEKDVAYQMILAAIGGYGIYDRVGRK